MCRWWLLYALIVEAILIFFECISLGFCNQCCVSYYLILNHVICFTGNVGNTKFWMLVFWNLCIQFLLLAGLTRFFFSILNLVTLKQKFKNVSSYFEYIVIPLLGTLMGENILCLMLPAAQFKLIHLFCFKLSLKLSRNNTGIHSKVSSFYICICKKYCCTLVCKKVKSIKTHLL